MSFNQQKYINSYNKEAYYTFKLRVYKGKEDVIKAVSLKTGKSINQLFIEAFEKQYKVDLSKKIDWEKFTEELAKIGK